MSVLLSSKAKVLCLGFLFSSLGLWSATFVGVEIWAIRTTDDTSSRSKTQRSIQRNQTFQECEWKSNESLPTGCFEMLNALYNEENSWVFLGDSTMARLFDAVYTFLRADNVTKKGERCHVEVYMGFPKGLEWTKQNFSAGEGPVAFGSKSHFCTDCSGCNANQRQLGNEQVFLEYLPVEFARDREIQTDSTDTTQATVATYLVGEYRGKLSCVVNSGVHDMIIIKETAIYVQNVREYLLLLSTACRNIVWMSISACKCTAEQLERNPRPEECDCDRRRPQRNRKIDAFNIGVKEMIRHELPHVRFLDIFPNSLYAMHRDNVHMTPSFYVDLGKFISAAAITNATVDKSGQP